MMRSVRHVVLACAVFAAAAPAFATEPAPPAAASADVAPKQAPQGVAVVASGAQSRDDAFSLARAVYASSLRPRQLDELRARILAGDPPPETASREVRDLAELRRSIASEDAASRQLLSSIARQTNVQALLVVSRRAADAAPSTEAPLVTTGVPATPADAGAAPPPAFAITARLFLADTNDFDAARYEPETAGGGASWRGTVSSLEGRFPPPAVTAQLERPPPKMIPQEKESRPFYMSGWLWGAIGAAVLVGGVIFFASQDTSNDPIHLQMRVPR